MPSKYAHIIIKNRKDSPSLSTSIFFQGNLYKSISHLPPLRIWAFVSTLVVSHKALIDKVQITTDNPITIEKHSSPIFVISGYNLQKYPVFRHINTSSMIFFRCFNLYRTRIILNKARG